MAEIHVEQRRGGGMKWLWLLLVLLLLAVAYWLWARQTSDADVTVPAAAGATSALEVTAPLVAMGWTGTGAIATHAGEGVA